MNFEIFVIFCFFNSAQVRLSTHSEQAPTQKLLFLNKLAGRLIGHLRYFKNKLKPKGLVYFQEAYSTNDFEKRSKADFGGDMHFSHGSSNSYEVLIAITTKTRSINTVSSAPYDTFF